MNASQCAKDKSPAGTSHRHDVQQRADELFAGEGLAPMVRASTTPLRTLAMRYGADFVYSEELVDRSILETTRVVNTAMGTIDYNKNIKTNPNASSKKAAKKRRRMEEAGVPPLLLRIDRKVEGGKFIFQIGSGEPELAAAAALHVCQDVDAIDINMGCPKKFSVSGGMGSALLEDPDRACAIVRRVCESMHPRGIPVSAKIRLIRNSVETTVNFLSGLVAAGVNAVAVHGRQVGDEGTQPADWHSLRTVVSSFRTLHPSIPILVNGDFYTRQEFVEFMESTGASGVLLARPALYNTSIFRKPRDKDDLSKAKEWGYKSPLLLDKTTVVQDYLREAVRYRIHYKNVKYVVCEFMSKRRAPIPRSPFLPQVYPGGQTIDKTCAAHDLKSICDVWNVDYESIVSNSSPEQQQQQGEHKYLDSYFLDREEKKTDDGPALVVEEDSSDSAAVKRQRLENGPSPPESTT